MRRGALQGRQRAPAPDATVSIADTWVSRNELALKCMRTRHIRVRNRFAPCTPRPGVQAGVRTAAVVGKDRAILRDDPEAVQPQVVRQPHQPLLLSLPSHHRVHPSSPRLALSTHAASSPLPSAPPAARAARPLLPPSPLEKPGLLLCEHTLLNFEGGHFSWSSFYAQNILLILFQLNARKKSFLHEEGLRYNSLVVLQHCPQWTMEEPTFRMPSILVEREREERTHVWRHCIIIIITKGELQRCVCVLCMLRRVSQLG